MENGVSGTPVGVGSQQGPRSILRGIKRSKQETARHLANHPGRGEPELRRAATELGLAWEASPPIDRWYPDLVFRPVKLIIEVDGAVHFQALQIYKDKRKDEALRNKGWTVVRVWAGDARKRPREVLLGAFTRAFGLGNEEAAMAKCRASRTPKSHKKFKKHKERVGPQYLPGRAEARASAECRLRLEFQQKAVQRYAAVTTGPKRRLVT
jgi:very-short-patch-repair endonuclease